MAFLETLQGRARGSLRGIRAVTENRGLRRVVVAYAGFNVGEWATWIAGTIQNLSILVAPLLAGSPVRGRSSRSSPPAA